MIHSLNDWLKKIGTPRNYAFQRSFISAKKYSYDFGELEYYRQANGPGTFQRVVICMPKQAAGPVPAVVVPFYFPEEMLGFNPATGEVLKDFTKIAMMKDLAERGFATISADSYHLTYLPEIVAQKNDFNLWKLSGEALVKDHPEWTGIGKLIADTRLLIDVIAADPRVDPERISITGHSLGGKMAFYTGMIDPRIRAVMASDFGIGFDQTNWSDIWYWGAEKLQNLKDEGYCHSELLTAAAGKPFCLLAGLYDNADSWSIMQKATGYENHPERLKILNHATGHRPPTEVLNQGYDFLEQFGK